MTRIPSFSCAIYILNSSFSGGSNFFITGTRLEGSEQVEEAGGSISERWDGHFSLLSDV